MKFRISAVLFLLRPCRRWLCRKATSHPCGRRGEPTPSLSDVALTGLSITTMRAFVARVLGSDGSGKFPLQLLGSAADFF